HIISCLRLPTLPRSPLLPYTTLFRSVYLVYDAELRCSVALKVPRLQPGDGPEVLSRFDQEVKATSAIEHPNICTVYEFDGVDCRSEEHTSELQSRSDLVCRLLLEKKK